MMRIASFLYSLAALADRKDVSFGQKVHVLFSFSLLKFSRGNHISFLGYRIAGSARANTIGILKEIFLQGDYAFASDIACPLIIDAGGNIGISALFFKWFRPQCRVIVFEASSRNFDLLTQNIAANKLKDVRPVFGALGNSEGSRSLFFNEKKPGGSTTVESVVATKDKNSFVEERVPALKLSEYIDEDVALLKLDVEGSEGEIIEELDSSGKLGRIGQIVMEYHVNPSNEKNRLAPLLESLERHGFSWVIYDNENGAFGKRLRPVPYSHFMIRAYRN